MAKKKATEYCGFCGNSNSKVGFLINGLEAQICDNCAVMAAKIVEETRREEGSSKSNAPAEFIFDKKPSDIVAYLNEYIIGQDFAKKVISVAIFNHYKRIGKQNLSGDVEIEKSNILLVGNTGTGKTLLAKTVAKLLNVPFAIADATAFTQSGYVGEDIESVISRLLQNCNYNIESAQKGIVFIDEIDKIARKGENPSITRDVAGEGVQQGLLKLLEGSEILVPPQGGRKHPEQPMVKVDTKNILFICGGAFEGLERIIAQRVNKSSVGFKKTKEKESEILNENLLKQVNALDIKKFGIIPELLGRLPVIVHLNPLDRKALQKILLEPKNAIIKQYIALLKLDGKKLEFSKEALEFILDRAMEYELGARGLRSICEAIMTDVMYESPNSESEKIIVTKDMAEKNFNQNSGYQEAG
ncbi:MAG: ATP-dependent Clp protease ATP-binding subunit ClpX [Chitinophagales bacterium]|nr:ATP-dependent Clp protease ATP-binding subunit ClpX [Sphingobacteriales bacterium]